MVRLRPVSLGLIMLGLCGFTMVTEPRQFRYEQTGATISLDASDLSDFDEEARGEDYYFMTKEGDIVCSVLYYRLNEQERWTMRLIMAQLKVPAGDPRIPLAHFGATSRTKSMESGEQMWHRADFSFKDVNVEEIEGMTLHQKHMYAYSAFGDSLFVQVHLSKVLYTAEDSTRMRQIIESVRKVEN